MPVLTALSLSTAAAGPATLSQLQLLDLLEVAAQPIDGLSPIELSGLAWDHDEARLYAVSDKGRIFGFNVEIANGRIEALVPVSGAALSGARKVNAEALWVRQGRNGRKGDADFLVADEATGDVLVLALDQQGQVQSLVALPASPVERERWLRPSSGVEALAWHAQHGLLLMHQRPLQGSAADKHTLLAGSGHSWTFAAHAGGKSSIKAIELIDGNRLLVLEKVKLAVGHQTYLRELRLDGCGRQQICDAPAAELKDDRLRAGDNFEGMTCIDVDLCLLVTDGGPSGSARSVLALVKLSRRGP